MFNYYDYIDKKYTHSLIINNKILAFNEEQYQYTVDIFDSYAIDIFGSHFVYFSNEEMDKALAFGREKYKDDTLSDEEVFERLFKVTYNKNIVFPILYDNISSSVIYYIAESLLRQINIICEKKNPGNIDPFDTYALTKFFIEVMCKPSPHSDGQDIKAIKETKNEGV